MTKKVRKAIIVDGYALLFRAYYAVPAMTTTKGEAVAAIHGFFSILFKVFKDLKIKSNGDDANGGDSSTDIVITLDSGSRSTFRAQIYNEYKANRRSTPEDLIEQINILPLFLSAFGLPFVSAIGYEADDCIASYVAQYREKDADVIIVSSDKDLLQLVNDRVYLFDYSKSKMLDENYVFERFAIKPSQMLSYLALVGDSADNIPGIKGIGPKAASSLLAFYSCIDEMYADVNNLESVVSKRIANLIIDGEDMARMSAQLVALCSEVPDLVRCEELGWRGFLPKHTEIFSILSRYELHQLRKIVEKNIQDEKRYADKKEQMLYTDDDFDIALQNFVTEAKEAAWLAISHIKRGGFKDADVRYFAMSGEEDERGALFLSTGDSRFYCDLAIFYQSKVRQKLLDVMNDYGIMKLCTDYNILYHIIEFRLSESWHDLNVMRYSIETSVDERVDIENNIIERYRSIISEIKKSDVSSRLYFQIDKRVSDILCLMESKGVRVNIEYLRKLDREFAERAQSLQQAIYEDAEAEFNIASPQQVAAVLFGAMGLHKHLPEYKDNGKHPGTGVEVLENLASYGFLIAKNILEWRHISKLRSSYIRGLLDAAKNERVHCTFNAHTTLTGRLSTNNPNLQSIPVKTASGRRVRQAIIATDGKSLISADYSQIEIRVLAHVAQCDVLLEMLTSGMDIHALTASEIFKVKYSEVNEDLRRKAKAINFGIVYGMSSFGLGKAIGVSNFEAKNYMDRYMSVYAGVKRYMSDIVVVAKEKGYVETLLGRRCYIQNINAESVIAKKAAERVAINAPIQGGAADIIRAAMSQLSERAVNDLILQIHDELLFDVDDMVIDERKDEIVQCMEGAVTLKVPLKVDVAIGKMFS